MAKAYLKFTRTGTFKYEGVVRVDVDDPATLKDIWAAAGDQLFAQYLVKSREYDNDEYNFELIEIENTDAAAANEDN